nr:hypothetical protein [Candidatus Brachybacter algidus]
MSTLPVKLTAFTAILNNNKVDLKWTTASEVNVSHFVVEKSTDGINYSDAGMALLMVMPLIKLTIAFPIIILIPAVMQ